MDGKLICKSLSIHTTTVCTLKCAKCGWSFPCFTKHVQADLDKTIFALEKIFAIYDSVKELRFGGAEAFLYPGIEKLMDAVSAYKAHFDYAILVTNGTYIPRLSIIEKMKQLPYPFMVRVDNYGELSKKYGELIDILCKNNIKIDERQYTKDAQAFGGWIDLGDYTYKNYSNEQLNHLFYNCRVPDDCTIVLNDMITICSYAFSGRLLGKINGRSHEVIHLADKKSLVELKNAVKAWRSEPLEACQYCNGCDPINSPRIPAAEQIV